MKRIYQETKEKKPKIDVKDKRILVLLSENSRIPISTIAKKTELSRDTVHYRISRLQKLGVILQFFSQINYQKLGFETFHVFLLVDEEKEERQKELLEALIEHPHVLSVLEYSDRWDYEIRMIAHSIKEFDNLIAEIRQQFSDIILERSVALVVDTYQTILLPYKFYENRDVIEKRKIVEYTADKKDLLILRELGKNCRLSTYEIAKNVPLSPDAIGLRIKKLYNSGIIRKFSILVNFSLLDYNLHVFSMQLKVFGRASEGKLKEYISFHKHIIKAIKIIGPTDVMITVISQNNTQFHNTIKEIKTTFSETIKNYITYVAYHEHLIRSVPEIIYS